MVGGRLSRMPLVIAAILVTLMPALVIGNSSAAQTATPAAGGLAAPAVTIETVPPAVEETKGPAGETATSYQDVTLTAEEVEQIRPRDARNG